MIHDVDFSFLNNLTFSLGWPCADPNGFSGIYEYPLENGPSTPLAVGGLVDCPVAHRQAGYTKIFVINAEPPSGNQLVRLDFNGASWDASPVGRPRRGRPALSRGVARHLRAGAGRGAARGRGARRARNAASAKQALNAPAPSPGSGSAAGAA
ncbi:MAG: hypothetical protein NTZ61_01810, partial [Proteobacteria bacterium]|nr:hypothetical protein [Pseudomonadota bacterium]